VTRTPTTYPRLHRHEAPPAGPPALLPGWAELAAAFQGATGWRLIWDDKPAAKTARGKSTARPSRPKLTVKSALPRGVRATTTLVSRERAVALAKAVERMLRELDDARLALWQQDAELATAIPVRAESDAARKLAERLQGALRAAAEAIGCHAAAAYLLDEGTSELKLRAAWGLPASRLAAPARPLRGALADLEALSGHAVSIENTAATPQWRVPEAFPAACVVPLASPTQLLGTVWVFARKHRDFPRGATNVVELAAQRIAADLEREVLLRETPAAKRRAAKKNTSGLVPDDRILNEPSSPAPAQALRVRPVLEGWEFAAHQGGAAASWCDWAELKGGVLSLAVAEVTAPQPALAATTVAASLAAHRLYPHDAGQLLERLNQTLCTTWAGGEQAFLAYGRLELASGRAELAIAGGGGAILLGPQREIIAGSAFSLGSDPEAAFESSMRTIAPGQTLLLAGSQMHAALKKPGGLPPADLAAVTIAKLERDSLDRAAAALAELAAGPASDSDGRSFLLLRRR